MENRYIVLDQRMGVIMHTDDMSIGLKKLRGMERGSCLARSDGAVLSFVAGNTGRNDFKSKVPKKVMRIISAIVARDLKAK